MPHKNIEDAKAYFRAYRLKNKKVLDEKYRIYRLKNKVLLRKKCKIRYWNNREVDLRRSREYRTKNLLKMKKYFRKYYKSHKIRIIKNVNKNSHKYSMHRRLYEINDRCSNKTHKSYERYGGRGIKCLLTLNDLIFLWNRDKAYRLVRPSIDRINNDGNYTVPNCQFIEATENSSKANLKHGRYSKYN